MIGEDKNFSDFLLECVQFGKVMGIRKAGEIVSVALVELLNEQIKLQDRIMALMDNNKNDAVERLTEERDRNEFAISRIEEIMNKLNNEANNLEKKQ